MSAAAGGVITPKKKAKRVAVWVPEEEQYKVNCVEARRWKCGKCWKHRLGFCPMGAKCTLSHETDEALQARNERNKLGGYLEGTKKDGYEWFAREVKKGSMTFPAGTFNADAPELAEALDYFSKIGKQEDVERIRSFIAANKVATAASGGAEPQEIQDFSADLMEELEEQDHLEAWAYRNACAIMINWIKQSQMALAPAPEEEDFQKEEKLLEQFWAAEEQREAEEAKPVRNWAVLAGGGAKPQVAVKAPVARTVKRAFPATVNDLWADDQLGSWGEAAME